MKASRRDCVAGVNPDSANTNWSGRASAPAQLSRSATPPEYLALSEMQIPLLQRETDPLICCSPANRGGIVA